MLKRTKLSLLVLLVLLGVTVLTARAGTIWGFHSLLGNLFDEKVKSAGALVNGGSVTVTITENGDGTWLFWSLNNGGNAPRGAVWNAGKGVPTSVTVPLDESNVNKTKGTVNATVEVEPPCSGLQYLVPGSWDIQDCAPLKWQAKWEFKKADGTVVATFIDQCDMSDFLGLTLEEALGKQISCN